MANAATISQLYSIITRDAEAGLERVAKKSRKVAKETKASQKAAKAFSRELSNLKRAALGFVAGFAGIYAIRKGLEGTVGAAIKFESAFAGVEKTVEGTAAQLSELRQGIRDMAKEIPATTTEIAGVAEAAGQLGIQTDAIMDFTRVMIDLGNTTNLSAAEAATALARLAKITQLPQDQFDRLGSTVVALGNNLATTEAEIVEMGLRLAGAGNTIGLTEAQVLSFAGALSSVGIRAEAGGTAFSKVMLEIDKSAAKGGEAIQGFADIAGMGASEFAQLWEDDAAAALTEFIGGMQELEHQGTNTALLLDELGLTGIRVGDSLRRTAGAGDLLRESLELGNQAWRDNNALTDEARQRYETTASKLRVIKQRLVDIGIEIGENLLPRIRDLVTAFDSNLATSGQQAAESVSRALEQLIGLVNDLGSTLTGSLDASAIEVLTGAFNVFADAVIFVRRQIVLTQIGLAETWQLLGRLKGAVTDTSKEWQNRMRGDGKHVDELKQKFADLVKLGQDFREAGPLIPESDIAAISGAAKEMEAFAKSLNPKKPKEFNEAIKAQVKELTALKKEFSAYTDTSDTAKQRVKELEAQIKLLTGSMLKLEPEVRRNAGALEELADIPDMPAGKLTKDFAFTVGVTSKEMRVLKMAAEIANEDGFLPLISSLKRTPKALTDLNKKARETIAAAEATERRIDSLAMSFFRLAGALSSGAGLGDLAKGVAGIFTDAVDAAGSFGEGMSNAWDGLKKSFGDQAGGFLVAADATISAFSDKYKSIGEKVGTGIGAGVGAYFGGPLGAAIGGKIGGWIGGWFSKPKWKKARKNVEKWAGFTISEGLARGIQDISDELGVGIKLAELIGLPDIIQEGLAAGKSWDVFAGKVVEGLTEMKSASGAVKAALKESVNQGFSQLIGKAIELEETSTATFQAMIRGAIESGEELQAVQQFIAGNLSDAVSDLSTIFEHLSDSVPAARLDDLAIIVGNVADALIANGGDIKELLPQIDQLIEKHKELGHEGTDAYKSLVRERNFLKNNEAVLATLGAETDLMKKLGDTTFLTTEGFGALQREGVRAYNQLIENGANEQRSLQAIAPFLQNAVDQSLARGEALDAETQKLVEQAAAMGLIETSGTSMTNVMTANFDRLIAAITGMSIEEASAFGKMEEHGTTAAANVADAWTGSHEQVADHARTTAIDINDAFDEMVRRTEVQADGMADAVSRTVDSVADAAEQSMAAADAAASHHLGSIMSKLGQLHAAGGYTFDFGELNLPGLAGGGHAEGGKPVIVGERGPEIFVPQQSGTIVPANQTAQLVMAGGAGGDGEIRVRATIPIVIESPWGRRELVQEVELGLDEGLGQVTKRALKE